MTVAVEESARHRALVSVSARASTDGRETSLEIEVSDQGPGMPPDILRRAGEPFFTTKPPRVARREFARLEMVPLDRVVGGELHVVATREDGTTARYLSSTGGWAT